MSAPFEKFIVKTRWTEWSSFKVFTFPSVPDSAQTYAECKLLCDERKKFIEDAIREKLERERG